MFSAFTVLVEIDGRPHYDIAFAVEDHVVGHFFACKPAYGIKYKFYSDLTHPNIIDTAPFFELDFENIKSNDIEILQHFSKESFENSSLISFAEELAYYSKLKPETIKLLRNPSDDFTKLIIKKYVSNVKITAKSIDRFRTVVKNAIKDALLEMFRQSIVQGDMLPEVISSAVDVNTTPAALEITKPQKKTKLPRMEKLFDWKLIKADDKVYIKNRQQEKAEVIDYKSVMYKGIKLTFNQWAQQVTGWDSICVYDYIIVEGQTETLGVLRRKKMMELQYK